MVDHGARWWRIDHRERKKIANPPGVYARGGSIVTGQIEPGINNESKINVVHTDVLETSRTRLVINGKTFFSQKKNKGKKNNNNKKQKYGINKGKLIGHFRVPKTLTFKMRLGAQPFLWKRVLFAWEWKMISISKAEHLPSFWNRGLGELGNGLLKKSIKTSHEKIYYLHSSLESRLGFLNMSWNGLAQSLALSKYSGLHLSMCLILSGSPVVLIGWESFMIPHIIWAKLWSLDLMSAIRIKGCLICGLLLM